jgi:hypothetical protein
MPRLLNVRNLRLDAILIFQEFLILKDGSGEGGRAWTLVRSGSLWVFKPEFIDSETLDFRVECPRGNA